MPSCFVIGCSNRSSNKSKLQILREKEGCSITFHRFPKKPNIRNKWITIARIDRRRMGTSSSICSDHFPAGSFEETSRIKRLKKAAVPSIINFSNGTVNGTNGVGKEVQKIVIEPDIPNFLNFSESEDEFNDESDKSESVKSEEFDEKPIKLEKLDEMNFIKVKNEFNGKEKESPLKRIKLENELSAETYLKSNMNITIRRITKPIKEESPEICIKQELKPIFVKKEKPPAQSPTVSRPTEFILNRLQKQKLLSLEQIEILRNINTTSANLMRTPWVPEFKIFAMTLYYFSSLAYDHVRKFFNSCLPYPQLILVWFKKSDGNPGFCKEAFQTLANLSKISKIQKNGKNLLFSMVVGEMKLKTGIKYDEKGKCYGWTDFGIDLSEGSCDLAENVFFIILTGVNNDFRIPIGYFLVNKMTGEQMASLIRLAVEFTAEAGVRTISLNFDQRSAYYSLTTSLGCEFNVSQFNKLKTYFEVRTSRVYVFPEINEIFHEIETCLKERKTIYYRKNLINFEFNENDLIENFHTKKFWFNLKKIREFFEMENFADKLKAQKSRKEIYDFLQSMIKYFSRLKLSLNENDLIVKSKYKNGFIGIIICLKSLFQIGLDFVRNRINAKSFPNFRLGQQHFHLFLNNFQLNSTAYDFMTEYKNLYFPGKLKFSNENLSISYNLINSPIKNINSTIKKINLKKLNFEKINFLKINTKLNKTYNINYLSIIVALKIIKEINCEICHRFLIQENVKNSKFSLKTIENKYFYPTENLLKICELTNKCLIENDLTNRLKIIKNVFNKILNLNIYKKMCCHQVNRFGLFDHDLLLIRTIIEVYLEVRCDILIQD